MRKPKIVALAEPELIVPIRPRIVAICPTVERQDLVRQLVKSIRETTDAFPPTVFVVMGDDDGTEGWLLTQASTGLPLAVIRPTETLPYAKAVNLAASTVDADWLLLLNNDLILQPGYWAALDEMIALGYEIIGSKLIYLDGHIQHYGKWFTLDWFPFHVLRYQPQDHPQSLAPRPFPDVTFAAVAIKKAIWDDLGGLDEQFVNGYEDDDYCLQARERGAQIGVHPGMLAIHLEAQTTGKDSANKEAQYLKFAKKWVETGRISWPLGVHQGWRS